MNRNNKKDIVKDSHQVKDSNSFARVNVNYKNQKPEVKFSFPGEKEPGNAVFYSFIISFFILVGIQLIYYGVVSINTTYFGEGGYKNAQFNQCTSYYNSHYKEIIKNTCTTINNTNSLVSSFYYFKGQDTYYFLKQILFYQVPVFLVLWWIIFFYFGKALNKNEPRMQIKFGKKFERHYSAIFTEVPKTKYIEIPLFKNVWLDYNATGDFSKYLKEVDIREHPFTAVSHLGRKKADSPNTYLWRARFYFSRIPKNGQLEVEFK